MSDKLADNIRRIVGTDKQRSNILGPRPEKESIPGSRGASFAPPGTSGVSDTTVASGTAGESLTGISSGLVNSGIGYDSGAAGATLDPNDPSRAVISDGGNSYSALDILNGDGPAFYDSSAIDGSGSDALNESLDSITGMTDCATGKEIEIHTKNGIPAPDGWTDINTPPNTYYPNDYDVEITGQGGAEVPSIWEWEAGTYYYAFADINYPHAEQFFRNAAEGLDFLIGLRADIGWDLLAIEWRPNEASQGQFRLTFLRIPEMTNFVVNMPLYYCTPGSASYCPLLEPNDLTLPELPSNDIYDMALTDTGFLGSELEHPDDEILRLKNRQSKVDFCFGTGRFGSIEVTKNGGFMIYETDSEGGTITGGGTVYNSSSQAVATITTENEVIQHKP